MLGVFTQVPVQPSASARSWSHMMNKILGLGFMKESPADKGHQSFLQFVAAVTPRVNRIRQLSMTGILFGGVELAQIAIGIGIGIATGIQSQQRFVAIASQCRHESII